MSKNDLGPDDLYRLADFVDDKTSKNTVGASTLSAKNDVFLGVFRKLYDQIKERTILGSVLASVVRHEFVSVREVIAAHDYPNFQTNPGYGSSCMKPRFWVTKALHHLSHHPLKATYDQCSLPSCMGFEQPKVEESSQSSTTELD
ncbi:MAG: hypothetical protein J3R72DRAFT_422760 [Linnemannia gamsii]|nr:MAG: hypothetical protein J3R72DRAFT_422760 [Linnemannia gamsii]